VDGDDRVASVQQRIDDEVPSNEALFHLSRRAVE
jgi:hypothetical protein